MNLPLIDPVLLAFALAVAFMVIAWAVGKKQP